MAAGAGGDFQSAGQPGQFFRSASVEQQPVAQSFGDVRLAKYRQVLKAVDSTLWYVLPRMSWALWRSGQKAVRLHVKFLILEQHVSQAELSHANLCEAQTVEEVGPARTSM